MCFELKESELLLSTENFLTKNVFRFQLCLCKASHQIVGEDEIRAKAFLTTLNNEVRELKSKQSLAQWNFVTNVSMENEKQQIAVDFKYAKFIKMSNCV